MRTVYIIITGIYVRFWIDMKLGLNCGQLWWDYSCYIWTIQCVKTLYIHPNRDSNWKLNVVVSCTSYSLFYYTILLSWNYKQILNSFLLSWIFWMNWIYNNILVDNCHCGLFTCHKTILFNYVLVFVIYVKKLH